MEDHRESLDLKCPSFRLLHLTVWFCSFFGLGAAKIKFVRYHTKGWKVKTPTFSSFSSLAESFMGSGRVPEGFGGVGQRHMFLEFLSQRSQEGFCLVPWNSIGGLGTALDQGSQWFLALRMGCVGS